MAGKNNTGALFKNDRKGTQAAGAPDYNGTCMVDGAEYRIGAWLKEGKNGKYMSLSFKTKSDAPKKKYSDADDDAPF